jgi:gliding motility-associated-like protein
VYGKKGIYTVKLTIKTPDGCTDVATQHSYVNVANFSSDFSFNDKVCQGTTVHFTNRSSPIPNTSFWDFAEAGSMHAYGGSPSYATFYNPGVKTVKLTNTFGNCQETSTKTITVLAAPVLNGFEVDLAGVCGAPVTVKYRDTSSNVVKRQWNFNWNWSSTEVHSTEQAPSRSYTADGYYQTLLTVTNAAGCITSVSKPINIVKPNVAVNYTYSSSPMGNYGCLGFTMKFGTSTSEEITEYKWDFGDGATSTQPAPEHTFNKAGTFQVRLNYTTKSGCKYSAYFNSVYAYKKPDADFATSNGTDICGNTAVLFKDKSAGPVTSWQWDFGDQVYDYNSSLQHPSHQYYNEGTYRVRLIAYNGTCSDTAEKTNYIKVFPPFPDITQSYNTCEGTRGTVTFQQASRQANSLKWDFGDGNSVSLNDDQPEIKHTYTKTGTYKVVLTATNGQCSVRDSITTYALLKQSPKLTANKKELCGNDELVVQVSGVESNPYPMNTNYNSYYNVIGFKYGDSTDFAGGYTADNYYWTTTYKGRLNQLANGKESMRAILVSTYFGCYDTTDLLPIKIKGPVASFAIPANNICYKSPIAFEDRSTAGDNVPIKQWEWDFGDGKRETKTKGESVLHKYPDPGAFYVTLKVTDEQGCHSTTPQYRFSNYAQLSGPKAAISVSAATVQPNSTVHFYNITNNWNSPSTEYKWVSSDGSSSTDYYLSKRYTELGVDTMKLIAKNPVTNCTDTAIQIIYIKNVNASFTFTTSYINNNSCPPVVVKFTNTSTNAQRVAWDFGDGGKADNQNFPSHTYYKPGVYKVKLYSYGFNNAVDSIVDSITVKGPYAILKADVLSGCLSQTVTLSAEVKNASSYTWDFADGSLKQTSDTFAVHQYQTAGVYTPSLIMKDGSGCSATSDLDEKIVIDSLQVSITNIPPLICDSSIVSFVPGIQSVAVTQMQQQLQYKWSFGTTDENDSSDLSDPSFNYNVPGTYQVTLKVQSPYGCAKETTKTVVVTKTVKGKIDGPVEACEEAPVQFNGSKLSGEDVKWKWIFSNGNSSDEQNPDPQIYSIAGSYNVDLVVDHSGCYDTARTLLTVRPIPVINAAAEKAAICLADNVQLNAGGGNHYVWYPSTALNNTLSPSPIASPEFTTTYFVNVTNEFGCENRDSLTVIVARPFEMSVSADTFVCKGSSVQLRAQGAASYSWIRNIDGLSNRSIDAPVASPVNDIVYTVVGTDAYSCFTDTADIFVAVQPLPTIHAGADLELLTGSTQVLETQSSSDVVQWNWSPADYLDCATCPSPVTTPRADMQYVVTAKTQYGCAAIDTVNIKLICSQSKIGIPNSFTPNDNGKNDEFRIKGRGVKTVKSMRVFNRWGQKVFERTNFDIDDPSAAWNGIHNGYPVPAGAYVYVVELICDTGELFVKKGSMVLVR